MSSPPHAASTTDDASRASPRVRSCMLPPAMLRCVCRPGECGASASAGQDARPRVGCYVLHPSAENARILVDPTSGDTITSVTLCPATSAVLPRSSSTAFEPVRVMRICLGASALALANAVNAPGATLLNDGVAVVSSPAPGSVT